MDNIVRKNIVRKGEIARHNVFHSYISLVRQNAALCGDGLTLYHTIPNFWHPNQPFENIVGKRRKCW